MKGMDVIEKNKRQETETVASNQFLFENEKGCYFKSESGKIYFPDRSFTDVEAGCVTDVKITSDKGSYAFFTGKMVRDKKQSVVSTFFSYEKKAVNRLNGMEFFQEPSARRGRYAGSDVIFIRSNKNKHSDWSVWVDEEFFCWVKDIESCLKINHSLHKGMKDISDLMAVAGMFNHSKYTSPEAKMLGILRLICLEIYPYPTEAYQAGFLIGVEFGDKGLKCVLCGNDVVGNDVVLFTREGVEGSVYVGNLEQRMCKVLKMSIDNLLSQLGVSYKSIDIEDIWEFAKKYHVAVSKSAVPNRLQSIVHQGKVGSTKGVSVELLNPVTCRLDVLMDTMFQKELEAQIQDYIAWIKNICKFASKETPAQVSKLREEEKEKFGYILS